MPRGRALGYVAQLPEADDDGTSMSRKQMLARMDVCMGGRVAEELIFGADEVTRYDILRYPYARHATLRCATLRYAALRCATLRYATQQTHAAMRTRAGNGTRTRTHRRAPLCHSSFMHDA